MRATTIWILLCAHFVACGWLLSVLQQLNRLAGAVVLVTGVWVLFAQRNQAAGNFAPRIHGKKLRRRFGRLFPGIFLFIAVLIFISGMIYPPNNYDALTYRLPRMLNWLSAGHWFWIPTVNGRLNYSTSAWEWVAMPVFALFRSDRPLFLINAISFLLMPGLLFSLFRQLGVARKVAWNWMWILPLAYGYTTQAGGLENDLTGTVFVLAAMCFCLRARQKKEIPDLWLAGLAAGLMTGAKLSNLPLLLPCLIAVWPALGKLREKAWASIGVAAVAILISAAPTVALNHFHSGLWTGDPKNISQIQTKNPPVTLLGNSILLTEQSLMPPVFPQAGKVNAWLNQSLPASWQEMLQKDFPRYYLNQLNELPQEELSGLGLGVTLLLIAGIVATFFNAGRKKLAPRFSSTASLVILGAWIAVLAYLLKMGSEATGRLMLPYYPLAIIPFLLLPGQERLWKFRAAKAFAALAVLSVLPALFLSPARPLFPAVPLSQWLVKAHPGAISQRMEKVYVTYARRNDALAPIREQIPPDARTIGFLGGYNDTDYALWRPFGMRRVVSVLNDDEPVVKIPHGVQWVVCKRAMWPEAANGPLEEWAMRNGAVIVWSGEIETTVISGPQVWHLLRLEKPGLAPDESAK